MIGIGTYGMEDNVALGESADWHSIHTPCCKTKDEFRTGKPCLLQEAWVPTPSTRAGEKDLEDHLSKSLAWTLKFGGCGLMPWNWNMSMVNWRYKVGFVDTAEGFIISKRPPGKSVLFFSLREDRL